ncbi:DUF1365 domain-containing protein [Antrihabitans cavernicola]|uniref:DUF1365 domain-containing protein n=1 Tax=Antrihabitans cavernicola TaxID=2495913 RepID=A0A5A7S922_9NOCA|nr:DUF1365 domain-containing protein [Spelaeibacter cavernicola]KAA0021729.1 DUF1365 domain-containing protein [Spelaeibacter cavernicola]
MITPALYATRIRHVRTEPVANSFEYRSYSWLIDIDDLPRLPALLRPFARFQARDHFDGPAPDLRGRVDGFLDGHGVDLDGGRVIALLSARVLGYVFNPLSLYWCYDSAGALQCVIAEVHNTYGQRHSYLVHTDARGRATTDKKFYVSPFNEVDGRYAMSFPEPGESLTATIVLHREGHAPFTASMRGQRSPATNANVLRAQLRMPLAPLMVSARIRRQAIALWARGLPIMPRPKTIDRQEVHT